MRRVECILSMTLMVIRFNCCDTLRSNERINIFTAKKSVIYLFNMFNFEALGLFLLSSSKLSKRFAGLNELALTFSVNGWF